MTFRISLHSILTMALVGIVFFVVFSSAALQRSEGRRDDVFGRVAHGVAQFPDTVSIAIGTAKAMITGVAGDIHLVLPRDIPSLEGFEPVKVADTEEVVPGLMVRATGAETPGWRLLSGAFMLSDGPQNAALLMNPQNEVQQVWRLHETALTENADQVMGYIGDNTQNRKLVHGIEILEDGGLAFVFDGGNSFQRVSACGELEWVRAGHYHHSVAYSADDNTLWTMRRHQFDYYSEWMFGGGTSGFVQVDAETGEILRQFTVGEIADANPDLGIFGIARHDTNHETSNPVGVSAVWNPDPWHFNDVEPLPAAWADAFPMFEAGDVVISARTTNAIFVVDPDTLEVKWYRIGAWERQHDPDFRPDGTIMVFDNRMGRGRSDIVTVDPVTMERKVVVNGDDHDFYTYIRGKQQVLPNGHLTMVSPQQGRVLELDGSGEIALEMYNLKPETEQNYVVTEVLWLPPDTFDPTQFARCSG